ncbi:MAG: hypothetical protein KC416_13540, partial [Myxococcales bacterium]|nr:hypothetical protein [Myxococcales bacterium]
DGVADPHVHSRIAADPLYLRIDPVSSREQYRWMERFIEDMEEVELRQLLSQAIDGKGAFRRFKDVLLNYPVERERWYKFRSDRLRSCMETWLDAHCVRTVERSDWVVPTAEEIEATVKDDEGRKSRVGLTDDLRTRLRDLVEVVPARELETAVAFFEFLRDRPRASRTTAKEPKEGSGELRVATSKKAVEG